ncbi:MAG: acyl-CoA thioesterase [Pyrinomonadaceae bacterium]
MLEFAHSFAVTTDDIDAQGHVNNIAYVRWIQDVAVAHWFSITSEEMREKYTWVVLRHEIDYKKQAFENELVTAITWVGEPTRISWERFTEIRRGADLLVKAKSIWCLIDRRTMKPTRITTEFKELFDME